MRILSPLHFQAVLILADESAAAAGTFVNQQKASTAEGALRVWSVVMRLVRGRRCVEGVECCDEAGEGQKVQRECDSSKSSYPDLDADLWPLTLSSHFPLTLGEHP
jgi:hypothetical protein